MVKDKNVSHHLVGWPSGQFCWSWPGITDVADVIGQLDWGWRNQDVRSPCVVVGNGFGGVPGLSSTWPLIPQEVGWGFITTWWLGGSKGAKEGASRLLKTQSQKPQLLLPHSIHQSGHKSSTCCWLVLAVTSGISGIRLRVYWAGGMFSLGSVDRVTVRKARGPQAAWRNKLQVAGILFLLYTKLREASLILCWGRSVLPWANQCVFLMEMFFLNCVIETMYLLWNLSFFKMVPPKTNFFLFPNPGLTMAQQTRIPLSYFMAGGWHTFCYPISKVHIVGEGPGAIPLVLRCLSYLINSFLTDIKHLAKTSKGALFLSHSDVYVRSFPYLYYTLIKLCYTKISK